MMGDSSPGLTRAARRFSLIDGMILVAAVAAGLAPLRWVAGDWSMASGRLASPWDVDLVIEVVWMVLDLTTPVAMAWTLGMLALWLRPPRPRRRTLVRQPGMVACLAAALGGVAASALTVVEVFLAARMMTLPPGSIPYAHNPTNWLTAFAFLGPVSAGFAVAFAWSTLALVGRWRAEPTWLDRAGRLVGLVWLVMWLPGLFVVRVMIN